VHSNLNRCHRQSKTPEWGSPRALLTLGDSPGRSTLDWRGTERDRTKREGTLLPLRCFVYIVKFTTSANGTGNRIAPHEDTEGIELQRGGAVKRSVPSLRTDGGTMAHAHEPRSPRILVTPLCTTHDDKSLKLYNERMNERTSYAHWCTQHDSTRIHRTTPPETGGKGYNCTELYKLLFSHLEVGGQPTRPLALPRIVVPEIRKLKEVTCPIVGIFQPMHIYMNILGYRFWARYLPVFTTHTAQKDCKMITDISHCNVVILQIEWHNVFASMAAFSGLNIWVNIRCYWCILPDLKCWLNNLKEYINSNEDPLRNNCVYWTRPLVVFSGLNSERLLLLAAFRIFILQLLKVFFALIGLCF